jgi:hypothetical protein
LNTANGNLPLPVVRIIVSFWAGDAWDKIDDFVYEYEPKTTDRKIIKKLSQCLTSAHRCAIPMTILYMQTMHPDLKMPTRPTSRKRFNVITCQGHTKESDSDDDTEDCKTRIIVRKNCKSSSCNKHRQRVGWMIAVTGRPQPPSWPSFDKVPQTPKPTYAIRTLVQDDPSFLLDRARQIVDKSNQELTRV